MILKDPGFRIIFENAPIAISVVDAALTIIDANAAYCEMLGYSKEELVGRRIPELTHPEDRQRDIEFLPLLLAGQLRHYRAEKRYIHRGGATVWGKLTATALLDDTGKAALYAFDMVEDITKDKTLRNLLPACTSCRRVRDDQGYWNQVEVFLRDRAAIDVSWSLCPECARAKAAE